MALCHDVGEVKSGDIPDDGSVLHSNKDEQERVIFGEAMQFLPSSYYASAQTGYWHFQNKDTHNGKAIYVLDKLEAVLTLLFYEKHGCVGMLTAKNKLTEADRYYVYMTESEKAADCWAVHLYAHIRDLPRSIKNPALELLDVAVRDVRGEPFRWCEKDFLPYEKIML